MTLPRGATSKGITMTPSQLPDDIARLRRRRERRGEDQRLLNNLPLAHRLATERAGGYHDGLAEYFLGQAMVGLVEAADSFDFAPSGERFGAWAEPAIRDALERLRDESEVELAQARVARAIADQQRTRELASFLGVPTSALVGGLMDAAAHESGMARHMHLVSVA